MTPLLRLATFVFNRLHRRSRLTHDRCTNCGYDLRGTPNFCPECGRVPHTLQSTW